MRIVRPQFIEKLRIFELFGLHYRYAVSYSVFLYVALADFLTAAGGIVGHRDGGYDIEAVFYEGVEAFDCKFGCAEKYYSEFVLCHCLLLF